MASSRKKQPAKPPTYFGWRFIWWNTWLGLIAVGKFVWVNAITVLMTIQSSFSAFLLTFDVPDPDNPHASPLISHTTARAVTFVIAVIGLVLSRIDRRPKKGKK